MASGRMLRRSISICEELCDCSLVARLLYTWGLPHSSDWGVLAASPRKLQGIVFPLNSELLPEIEEATQELVNAGLWEAFEADGAPFVCYPTFDRYQDVRKRTSALRDGLPLPPGKGGNGREVHETSHNSREVPGKSGKIREKSDQEKRSEEKRSEENLTPLSETDSNGVSDISPEEDSGGSSGPAVDAKTEAKARAADRARKQTENLDIALAALTETDRNILDRMIAGQEQEKGKPLTLLQQTRQAELYAKELAEHGPDCWRGCCEISCAKQVYTVEYARGCTKHWKPEDGCPFSGPVNGKRLDAEPTQADLDRATLELRERMKRQAIAEGTYDGPL